MKTANMKILIISAILFSAVTNSAYGYDFAHTAANIDIAHSRALSPQTTVGDPGVDTALVSEQAVREALNLKQDALANNVTSFNARTGDITPLVGDYSSFYLALATCTTAGQVPVWGGSAWGCGAGGSGSTTFIGDTDTPSDYTGFNGYYMRVNATEDGVEFVVPPSGVTNLTNTPGASTVDVESSSGSNTTLPAATTSLAGVMAASDKTKLDGVATGATANSSDAILLDRANHTGTQTSSTISDFSASVSAIADMTKAVYDTDADSKVDLAEGITADASGNVTIQMGDAAGANKISLTDLAGVEVGSMDSDGLLTITGLTVEAGVDGERGITVGENTIAPTLSAPALAYNSGVWQYQDASGWHSMGSGTGSGYVATPPTYSDEACTPGEYALSTTTGYVCVSSGDWNTFALTDWDNPSPATYTLVVTDPGNGDAIQYDIGGSDPINCGNGASDCTSTKPDGFAFTGITGVAASGREWTGWTGDITGSAYNDGAVTLSGANATGGATFGLVGVADYQWNLDDNAATTDVIAAAGTAGTLYPSTLFSDTLHYTTSCLDGSCFDMSVVDSSTDFSYILSIITNTDIEDDTFTIQFSFSIPVSPGVGTNYIRLVESSSVDYLKIRFPSSNTSIDLFYRGTSLGTATINAVNTGSWQVLRIVFDTGTTYVYQGADESSLTLVDTVVAAFGVNTSTNGSLALYGTGDAANCMSTIDALVDQIKIWNEAITP